MNSFDRTIVVDHESKLDVIMKILSGNWRQMAADGHRLAVRIYEYKEQRTLEQQGLMWIRLGELAEQAWVEGRLYSAEVWHEKMKRDLLPDEAGPTKRCRKGYVKWATLPDSDERVLMGSTTQLTTFGMAEYLTALMAYGASEHGVRFSATPREMAGAI